jgi:carbon storage regulator
MLILTRKIKETIVIGSNIRVTVIAIRGREARVAIDAPREIPILRDELPQRTDLALEPNALGSRSSRGLSELRRTANKPRAGQAHDPGPERPAPADERGPQHPSSDLVQQIDSRNPRILAARVRAARQVLPTASDRLDL